MVSPSLLFLTATAFGLASAFQVNFPNPSDNGYWVTKHRNVLNWKANSTDPSEFSVALLNANQSSLIGNFQIANTLNTSQGSYTVRLDKIPSGTYSLLFVNSSNYELEHPQVYYTSDSFLIQPKGTAPSKVTANTSPDPDVEESPSTDGAAPDSQGGSDSIANPNTTISTSENTAAGSTAQSTTGNSSGALMSSTAASSLVGLFSLVAFANAMIA